MRHFVRFFGISAAITLGALLAVFFGYGAAALGVTAVLIGIEVALSFDNAIVNAKILGSLSPFWQRIFLSVGVIVAIFGMRVVFPIVIVMATAHETWGAVVNMALHQPEQYARALEHAHPAISAFGGAFLLMLVLYFFYDAQKDVHWLPRFERYTSRVARWWLPPILTAVALVFFAFALPNRYERTTLTAGAVGILLYAAMRLVLQAVERVTGSATTGLHKTGMAALLTFAYLELLDASFSFDGVLGAFAITGKVVLIAAGLGVGALWVRSLTVFMVRRGTLATYKYLEHGAHYAVGVLAMSMLISIIWNIPELITGLVTLGLIGASLWASVQALRTRR
ncbi:MAG TPA: DUF475 domain-containing protein [Candidatus Saccharimonadales bacterium]|nr:DUF475 domain-containing protein [Candidatus Saccharimonadales bacterium]